VDLEDIPALRFFHCCYCVIFFVRKHIIRSTHLTCLSTKIVRYNFKYTVY
jgi:hypothetical protein